MPESVIGAKKSDILHQIQTKEGSLTVTHNTRDIVANTIGHVLAVPTTHTIFWTWGSAFKNPSPELADQLFERYKDVPWKGDVLVRVGHASIVGDIQRMLARNEHVRGRPWNLKDIPGRVIESFGKAAAVIITVGETMMAKLLRMDFYNPYANTATVYHPRLGIGMHELGHAEFYNQRSNKSRVGFLIAGGMGLTIDKNIVFTPPFLSSYKEYQASKNAMKHFKSDQERRDALKMLEAGWATYMFQDTLNLAFLPQPISGALGAVLSYPASVAGHLMARVYPKQEQRFGYVFEGKKNEKHAQFEHKSAQRGEKPFVSASSKKPSSEISVTAPKKQELNAHQVLVATAKAPKARESTVEGKGGRQFSEDPLKNGKRPLHSNTSRITF